MGVGPYVGGACGLDRGRVMDGWRRSKVSLLRGYLEAAAKKREVSEKPGLQAIRRQVLFKTNLTPLSNVHSDKVACGFLYHPVDILVHNKRVNVPTESRIPGLHDFDRITLS